MQKKHPNKNQLALLYIPHPNEKKAILTAKLLLKEKLIACANIINQVTSLYEWEGKIKKEKESLLLAKSTFKNFKKIEALVKKVHPYSTPCLTILKLDKTNKEYLSWAFKQIKA